MRVNPNNEDEEEGANLITPDEDDGIYVGPPLNRTRRYCIALSLVSFFILGVSALVVNSTSGRIRVEDEEVPFNLTTQEQSVDDAVNDVEELTLFHEYGNSISDCKGKGDDELSRANCGLGYTLQHRNSAKWKVLFFGPKIHQDGSLALTHCPMGLGACPLSPQCEISSTYRPNEATKADVVVIFQRDVELLFWLNETQTQFKVLYWREAYLKSPSVAEQARYDLRMGAHWTSHLLNPSYVITPAALLQSNPVALRDRTNFALNVQNACGSSSSKRQIYLDRLVQYLGRDRVHQYGKCGTLTLPMNPTKLVSTYKFYFAFERTIQDGYCTEKFFHTIALPLVPVYYGTPYTPNVTTTPSFIKASDFAHPKYLAEYLLFLDSNAEEYNAYHSWRGNGAKAFLPEYLKWVAQMKPGSSETAGLETPEASVCCRLCDQSYLTTMSAELRAAGKGGFVHERWTSKQIEQRFFQGNFSGRAKANTYG